MNEQTWTKEPRLLRMEPSRLLSSKVAWEEPKYMQSRRVDEAKPSARSSQASDSLVSTRRTLRLVCSGWSLQTRYRDFFPTPTTPAIEEAALPCLFSAFLSWIPSTMWPLTMCPKIPSLMISSAKPFLCPPI